jgi:hypothetical protein
MKMLSTILTAAFIAGSCTVAMAQGGAAGGDQSQQGTMKDADKNPTGAGANPTAGNTAAPTAGPRGMTTAPVAGTPTPPNATKEMPAAGAGTGAVK